MSLKKISLICLFLFSSMHDFAQKTERASIKKIIKNINKISKESLLKDSVLLSLQKENDLVIGYSTYNNTWQHVPIEYFLISFNKKQCKAYRYSIKSVTINNEKPNSLDSMNVSKNYCDSILLSFIENKGWKVSSNEDSNELYCQHLPDSHNCIINDASSKSLVLITKKHIHISRFYAPEYFEYECCPGNENRIRFLNIMRPIVSIFLQ